MDIILIVQATTRYAQQLISKIFEEANRNFNTFVSPEIRELHNFNNKPAVQINKNRNAKHPRKEIDLKSQLSSRKPKLFDLNSPIADKKYIKSKYVSPGRNKDYSQMYQSHNTPFLYSNEQLQNFNKAVSLNSSSFAPEVKHDMLNAAVTSRDQIKRKKKPKQQSKPNNIKPQGNNKSLVEKYEMELMKAKSHRNDTQKGPEQRKHSKKRNISSNSGRSKLPYGLRKQLEELTSMKKELRYKSVDPPISGRNHILNSERAREISTNKIIVTDNFKNFVPTTSDDFKKIIDNEHKRHSSRFALRKYQDEMVNRLMNHKNKVDNKKELLKIEQNTNKDQYSSNIIKVQKSLLNNHQYNSKSFNEIQTEHELIKKSRLMELVNTRQQEVLSSCK